MTNVKKFLTSPITVLSSIVLGVLAGVYFPQESIAFEEVGTVYLNLLKVVVLPFLLATILVGVVSLLQRESASSMIKRIVVGFVLSMLVASAIGVGTVVLTGAEMTLERQASLGSLVMSRDGAGEMSVVLDARNEAPVVNNQPSFLSRFIPDNIFQSLNTGESLKVVIFCLIFGIALGNLKHSGMAVIVDALQAIQHACISFFKFLNYFLPFALLAMISSQVGKVGIGIFQTMLEFVMQQAIGGVAIIVAGTVLLVIRSKESLLTVMKEVKETLIVAVSSRSSLACIPYAQEALTRLKFDRGAVELMVPLSFTMNRIGSITYYAIATMFIANIYGTALGYDGLLIVLFGAVLAGLASAGTTGVLTVATVSIVCDLLRLPHEAIIVLLIAVDPVMDMIRTASHVYGNVAVASFVCDKQTAGDSNEGRISKDI